MLFHALCVAVTIGTMEALKIFQVTPEPSTVQGSELEQSWLLSTHHKLESGPGSEEISVSRMQRAEATASGSPGSAAASRKQGGLKTQKISQPSHGAAP